MTTHRETILIDNQDTPTRSCHSQTRPSLKSSLRKESRGIGKFSEDDDSHSRPKKVRVISPPKDVLESDSETEIESRSELDQDVFDNVLEKIHYKLENEYANVLPRFNYFMEAFDVGYELKNLPLTIKLTFLKIMNLEGQWRTYDLEYSIGYVKFSVLKALWTSLIRSAGNAQDVDDLLDILENSVKSITERKGMRESLRREFDSLLLDSPEGNDNRSS